ncbi:uncharacterized protein PFL1_02521 [Pseudozyma flocculosa PF-1]|uniref:SWI5-dependent HO expression protein 3 n=1 Tax=Pseudozyma flocculosa PF-1 TaxID=1277687 RepID=A0A061HB81_9BASI|nr:uncharacterized protein PFL1_02521 [Pseudozyma flocculosa PF-1]EPQ29848.1 hypothetical protein PFL1_02521 [Pseudozyma flocculosa PF-1]
MAAAASRFSISSRTSSAPSPAPPPHPPLPSDTTQPTAPAPMSTTPPASQSQSPALAARSLPASTLAAPSAASPSAGERPLRWLLIDVAESSRTFLRALASSEADGSVQGQQTTANGSSASSTAPTSSNAAQTLTHQKHLSTAAPVQGAAVGQLDKRLSLPFGGSVASNAPSSSKGPSKKPSFMSRLRSGSTSISSAASSSSEKENKSIDAPAAASQIANGASTPAQLSPRIQEARLSATPRQTVARLASATPESSDVGAAWALVKQCGVHTVDEAVGKAAANHIDVDPQALADLIRSESIEAVYIGEGTKPDRALAVRLLEALSAAGPQKAPNAIAVDPALTRALTAQDAASLVALAAQTGTWLALPTKWGRDGQANANALVQGCARDLLEGRLYSPSFTWDETLAVLESLDELRQTAVPLPPTAPAEVPAGRLPKIEDLSDTSMESTGSSVAASPRLGTPAADESTTNLSTAALRAKLQEAQHILRQKNALIAALEQQPRSGGSSNGVGGGSPSLGSSAKVARSPSPAASLRPRKTSVGSTQERNAAPSRPATPTRTRKNSSASVAGEGAVDGASTPRRPTGSAVGQGAARTRKNSKSSLVDNQLNLSPPVSSVNQFDSAPASPTSGALEPVKEARRNMDRALAAGLADSHRSPTVASENRRIASLTQQANGIAANGGGGGGGGGGSGKVIHALTAELEETKLQLDLTRTRLRAAQLQASGLQRQHDDLKDSLGRTRLENESNAQMLARKERQTSEALERARKAEHEAKELGRSSREWGTRVREVEAQLGQERILKARAEAQYEALSASWKSTREKLQQDVEQLRIDVSKQAIENSGEAQKLLKVKTEMEEAWRQRDMEKGALGDLLERLQSQQQHVERIIQQSVGALVERLDEYESHTRKQDDEVAYVGGELRRILRLMRSGSTDPHAP